MVTYLGSPEPSQAGLKQGTEVIKFGVVGYGYWGPNVVRNLKQLEQADVLAVCDKSPASRKRIQKAYPHVEVSSDANELITSADIDAIAVVTPVWTHYELAKRPSKTASTFSLKSRSRAIPSKRKN